MWVKDHSRSFKLVSFERLGAVFYSPSIVTMALYCVNSEIKRHIGDWSKIVIFSYPHALDAPVR